LKISQNNTWYIRRRC